MCPNVRPSGNAWRIAFTHCAFAKDFISSISSIGQRDGSNICSDNDSPGSGFELSADM